MYIPQNLNASEEAFIMKEFAGINGGSRRTALGSRHAYNGPSTRNFKKVMRLASKHPSMSQPECIPEFCKLDPSKQKQLFELLSFSTLKKWDFNVFDVADIDEENTLLFVSWGVICSPHSQIAMAQHLKESGEEVAGDTENFDGHDFLGECNTFVK